MKIGQVLRVLREMGPAAAGRRAYYAYKVRLGVMERLDRHGPFGATELRPHLAAGVTPASMLDRRRRGEIPFLFQATQLPEYRRILARLVSDAARNELVAQVDGLQSGRVRFFSRWDADLGDPINWQHDPVDGIDWPADRHWQQYAQFDPKLGDIKMVWEANRFAQAYTLTRAYALTGDEAPLRLCLRRVEEWIDANPPVWGVQWSCGQEISLRLMAWCFALQAAYGTGLLTPATFEKIAASIYRQALRIQRHIGFSRSLRNNHAFSEAVGLYTVGTLFPEFDRAGHWRRLGKRILQAEAARQIFADGAYIQHSMNYHRVMMHDCLWAVRLGALHGELFGDSFIRSLGRAAEFLYQMQDEPSGRVPNYGHNDGALVLPLSSCDFLDYRPVLQATHYLLHGQRRYDSGPWDEELLWLFGTDALNAPVVATPRASQAFTVGGYYTLRGGESWAMVRCHTYRTRPSHADMLHVDLWWRGENILRDTGSYRYYCRSPSCLRAFVPSCLEPHRRDADAPRQPPWAGYFVSTAAHNTIVVDGHDQMTKGPRFLWFDWTRSRLLEHDRNVSDNTETWCGEHYGYLKSCGVVHRREVQRIGDRRWTVFDRLIGMGTHRVVLSWHLVDAPWAWEVEGQELRLELPQGPVWLRLTTSDDRPAAAEVVRGVAGADEVCGWESLYYGERRPIPVLRLVRSVALPLQVSTLVGLGERP